MLAGAENICVLASFSMRKRLGLDRFVQDLLERHKGILLEDIPVNPTAADICRALAALGERPISYLVAIGGGSCIDLAKAIAALHRLLPRGNLSEEAVLHAIRERAYDAPHSFIPVIALPTTAGTGSEVTKWATVWDPGHKQKLSIDCAENVPKAAILIPEWTALMGSRLTLSTGLDALSHAMEALWANSRTPLSQALAIAAIEKIRRFLPRAVRPEEAADLEIRKEMCVGSLLAGLAFSITRTTACHAISYPLTMMYDIPHGLAAAITLWAVLTRNEAAVPKIGEIKALFQKEGGFSPWLAHLAEPIMPLRLSAFGISGGDLNGIVDLTFTAGRMDNNPVPLSKEEVLAILRECL
jgi:alcohol dehydrogenase class IV